MATATVTTFTPDRTPVGQTTILVSDESVNVDVLVSRAANALAGNATFLAIGAPSNAQTLAQVRALTRQNTAIIRLILGLLDSTDGT